MKKRKSIIYTIISLLCGFSLYIISLNLPESFGKKQFIIGVDSQKLIKQNPIPKKTHKRQNSGVKQILFAPKDKIFNTLITYIKKE